MNTTGNETSFSSIYLAPSTYVDLHTVLGTGLLTAFQYSIDAGGATASPQVVYFQIWNVQEIVYVNGNPRNYTLELAYELPHTVGTDEGIYTVRIRCSRAADHMWSVVGVYCVLCSGMQCVVVCSMQWYLVCSVQWHVVCVCV